MEKNMAILMADLSGYTALTETHGATSAADTIDRYMQIVADSLVGDCRLQERTGDEMMIVSSSPDSLHSAAISILQRTYREDHFLQVHGGLHYGKLLERNNSYFGAAINLTARIAAEAGPGAFWSSAEFINALTRNHRLGFEPKGNFTFKNVGEKTAIFELAEWRSNPALIDPVCRMTILDRSRAVQHTRYDRLFFCSQGCMDIFEKRQPVLSGEFNYA